MKIKIRKSQERGRTKMDWLDSRHGFSFGRYSDPDNINFGKLIVFNDDIISPGKGFGAHPHDNMEIITLVLEGELQHEDSMGNKGTIKPGEIQRMSAGKGIWHSEYNASKKDILHLLQIWIEPKEHDIKPSCEQKTIETKNNALTTLVSGRRGKESVYIHQDASLFLGKISKNTDIVYNLSLKKIYLFVIKGIISLNNESLSMGDTAEVSDIQKLSIHAKEESSILLIELPD